MANDFPPPIPHEWMRWAIDHAVMVASAIIGWVGWVELRLRMLRQLPDQIAAIEQAADQQDQAINKLVVTTEVHSSQMTAAVAAMARLEAQNATIIRLLLERAKE